MSVPIIDYNYYVPKKRKIKRARKASLILLSLALIVACIVMLNSLFNDDNAPKIVDYCQAQVTSMTTIAVNDAVLTTLTEKSDYSSLVTVVYGQNGQVELLQANTMLINALARKMARSIEINLEMLSEQGIIIPLGNLTGWPILAGIGPDITIVVSPHESVICDFISEFEQAGINQTRHKIYLNIVTSVELIMPSFHSTLQNSTQVLVAESVILGDVPSVYLSPTYLGGTVNTNK